jgi:hypothetical protein
MSFLAWHISTNGLAVILLLIGCVFNKRTFSLFAWQLPTNERPRDADIVAHGLCFERTRDGSVSLFSFVQGGPADSPGVGASGHIGMHHVTYTT